MTNRASLMSCVQKYRKQLANGPPPRPPACLPLALSLSEAKLGRGNAQRRESMLISSSAPS